MNRFYKTVGLFLLVTLVVLLAIVAVFPYNKHGYVRRQLDKQSMLSEENREPSIILVGGSNVAFGYNSGIICDSMDMNVINFGLHAGFGLKYIIDELSCHVKEGDIVVMSPEYEHFFNKNAYGEKPLADIFYLTKGKSIGTLNKEQFRCIIDNTPSYLRANIESSLVNLVLKKSNSVFQYDSFNEYGDVVAHWDRETSFSSPIAIKDKRSDANNDFIEYFISKVHEMQDSGVEVILYPPVMEETGYNNKMLDIQYIDSIMGANGLAFVCPPSEVVMPKTFFYDSEYHLNKEGAKRHSEHLIEILRKP